MKTDRESRIMLLRCRLAAKIGAKGGSRVWVERLGRLQQASGTSKRARKTQIGVYNHFFNVA